MIPTDSCPDSSRAMPPITRLVAVLGSVLLVSAAPLAAQHCVIPGTLPRLSVRAAGGAEWGGDGYAAGGTLAVHGQRWFVAGEFADRGWGLGRRTYEGLPLPGYMERQHQVLGARAGGARPIGRRAALCFSVGYAVGTGLRIVSSGDPLLGGVGFFSHRRGRADVEVVRGITVGTVQLLPAISVGVMIVREEELLGDIVTSGPTGAVPITLTVGVPIGRTLVLRPRVNVPRGDRRGTSYGVDASVQLGAWR